MTGDEDLVVGRTLQPVFAVGQASGLKGRVDADLVGLILQAFKLAVAEAKPPVFPVIRRTIRNPVRCIRQREQVRPEFAERHRLVHRDAVVQHVEVTPPEVDDAFAGRVLNVSVPDVPFLRNGPVEHGGAGGNLFQPQRDGPLKEPEALSQPIAGDAPAKRVKVLDMPESESGQEILSLDLVI